MNISAPTVAPIATTKAELSSMKPEIEYSEHWPAEHVPLDPQGVPSMKYASIVTHSPLESHVNRQVFRIFLHDFVIPSRFPTLMHCKSRLVQIPDAQVPPSSSHFIPFVALPIGGHFPLFPSQIESF